MKIRFIGRGNDLSISSIISDPAQDPHSYEADAQVLSHSRADIVIENGAGTTTSCRNFSPAPATRRLPC